MQEEPLINQRLLLERFPGKGGWTYARLPEIAKGKKNHFGWQKVRGFIDGYEVKQFHIMPMGKGQLMIAIKAEIRKAIKKKEGDWVDVVLYSLEPPLPLPEDFQLCLEDEPLALKYFLELSKNDKKELLDWIYAIKSEQVIVDRMASAINKLALKQPLFSQKNQS
ncbi:MAG: DUF1905 domain-containing protein [Sphingobacteriaceae bacterium]|nr:DUF1905 domain-containing protein [Sphingobacteriaceae bacterium]